MRALANKIGRAFIMTALMIALLPVLASPANAQSTCVEEPALGFFDGNGDGVLSVGEIRGAAPDNAELQGIAGQLEAAGVPGIQYSGCGGSGGGDTGGSGGGDTGGSASGGTSSGTDGEDGSTSVTDGEDGADGEDGEDGAAGSGESSANADTSDGVAGDVAPGENLLVTELPDTGQGSANDGGSATAMLVGVASVLMLLGAFAWRLRRVA